MKNEEITSVSIISNEEEGEEHIYSGIWGT